MSNLPNDLISKQEVLTTIKNIIHARLPEEAIYAAIEELPEISIRKTDNSIPEANK